MYKQYSIKRFIRGNDSDVYQYKNTLVKKVFCIGLYY